MEQSKIHKLKIAAFIFKGTSDDLFFWVLIDTLFLTVVKKFTVAEVSLVFTVSFWVALLFKRFTYESIKRMRVGKSLIFSAVLFLAAAVLITVGPTLPVVIVGQCLYEIAPDFYDVSAILFRDICSRDKKGRDYMQSSALASTMYSVITLLTALLVDPLMTVNPYLPMILCILARVFSLVLAIYIHARVKNVRGLAQGRRAMLKGKFVGRSTVYFLFMAAVFGAFCTLSISYLKLLLQDNLAVVYDEASVVLVFSYCIIATRVVKILGNLMVGRANRLGNAYTKLGVELSTIGIVAAICGLVGCLLTNMPAIVVTAAGLLCVYFIFDPMMDVTSFLSIENLNADQAMAVIYRRGLLLELISAAASTLMTVFIAGGSYVCVMLVLVLMSVVVLAFGIKGARYHHLRARDYVKNWPSEFFTNDNSLMLSAAILMMHYGAVQSFSFNPGVLEDQVGSVEHIGQYYRRFGYVGRRPYTLKGLHQSFNSGEPSAVLACHNGEYRWYPVLYADEGVA